MTKDDLVAALLLLGWTKDPEYSETYDSPASVVHVHWVCLDPEERAVHRPNSRIALGDAQVEILFRRGTVIDGVKYGHFHGATYQEALDLVTKEVLDDKPL